MPNGSAAGGILFVLVAAIAIGTFIGAIILMAAIGLYNLLAGKDRVPAVGMQHAILITFATSVVNAIVGLLIAPRGRCRRRIRGPRPCLSQPVDRHPGQPRDHGGHAVDLIAHHHWAGVPGNVVSRHHHVRDDRARRCRLRRPCRYAPGIKACHFGLSGHAGGGVTTWMAYKHGLQR